MYKNEGRTSVYYDPELEPASIPKNDPIKDRLDEKA